MAQLDSIQKELNSPIFRSKQVIPSEITEEKLARVPNALEIIPNVLLRTKLAPEVEKGRLGINEVASDNEAVGSGAQITGKLMAQMFKDAAENMKQSITQRDLKGTASNDQVIQAVKALYTL